MVCRMFATWWYWLPNAACGCRKNSFHRNQASVFRCKNSRIFWRPQCKALIEILAFKVPSVCSNMVCRMFETWWYWLPYAAFGCRKKSFHRNRASVFRCKNSLIFWRPRSKTLNEILALKIDGNWAKINSNLSFSVENWLSISRNNWAKKPKGRNYAMRRWSEKYKEVSVDNTYRKKW